MIFFVKFLFWFAKTSRIFQQSWWPKLSEVWNLRMSSVEFKYYFDLVLLTSVIIFISPGLRRLRYGSTSRMHCLFNFIKKFLQLSIWLIVNSLNNHVWCQHTYFQFHQFLNHLSCRNQNFATFTKFATLSFQKRNYEHESPYHNLIIQNALYNITLRCKLCFRKT